ncbi:hypothetical protein NDU88_001438 [Pleurodeles waltl]|uniref:Uncharacterized protein n=1 Tax=Pleurodeles waltl TaxID=8319 RepID=A0AAV7RD26_PLEWA|nr:hypothetical protein NDU88_001438 [Pleurodeles waltl]
MPTDKLNGKVAFQLLFSKALAHQKSRPLLRPTSEPEMLSPAAAAQLDPTMESILQEIPAVGKLLESMENKILELAADFCSIRADITGFHNKLTGLNHRITLVEDKLNAPSSINQELQSFRDKLMDLEDRSRKDNVHVCGFPERAECKVVRAFLIDVLPALTGLKFSPPGAATGE